MKMKSSPVPGNRKFEFSAAALRKTALAAALFVGLTVAAPQTSHAIWPFSAKKDYVAKVGAEVITKDDFAEAMKRLHMSNRVGKSLSEDTSFTRQNYKKFLSEIIELKLLKIEAENMGLDKDPEFVGSMQTYMLNMSLKGLREEKILKTIQVSDKEIQDYFSEQQKKKKEEKEKAAKEAEAAGKPAEGAQKKDDPHASLQDKKEDTHAQSPHGKKEDLNIGEGELDDKQREKIKDILFTKKASEKEKEFFAKLKESASIKVNEDALKAASRDKQETLDAVVAEINGKTILGKDMVAELRKTDTEEARKQSLDRLILHMLLDEEALKKDYIKDDPDAVAKVRSYRERLLVNDFKRKVLVPAIKIEEEEIKGYYEKNKENYREPDTVDIAVILSADKAKSDEVMEEIKKGADFSFLAKSKSIDRSGEQGGHVGHTNINLFPEDVRKSLMEAKNGDVLGPVNIQGSWAVIRFSSFNKGEYMPFDEGMKLDIARALGNEKFKTATEDYVNKLKKVIPIDVNEDVLGLFESSTK